MASTTSNSRTLLYAASTEASELISYAEATGDSHQDGPDVWISEAGLNASHILPGMPKAYLQDVLESRALYALGVPLDWQMAAFKQIFSNCGEVLKSPCVIDLKSKEIFRWVIMSSSEEADVILRNMNGLSLAGETIHFCRALPPGATFVFSEEYPLLEFLKWDVKAPVIDTQGAHNNPILPALPQQPIAVFIQPPTPKTGHAHPASPDEDKTPRAPIVLQPTNLLTEDTDCTVITFGSDDYVPQAASWAKIVGARGGARVMDRNPQHKPASSAPRPQTINRIPAVIRARTDEPLALQMRLVFLLNVPKEVTLTVISDSIKEGSVHSIRFGVDETNRRRYAGIIFQHANEAEIYLKAIQKERLESRLDRLPFPAQIIHGHAFPADDIIRLMGTPTFASRRLTIVKSKFFEVYKELQFRLFCESIVNPTRIQCIWLYNSGNGTIVFADVRSAVMIKDELESLRIIAEVDERNDFHRIQVTYSKDPCLQQLHFTKDMGLKGA